MQADVIKDNDLNVPMLFVKVHVSEPLWIDPDKITDLVTRRPLMSNERTSKPLYKDKIEKKSDDI